MTKVTFIFDDANQDITKFFDETGCRQFVGARSNGLDWNTGNSSFTLSTPLKPPINQPGAIISRESQSQDGFLRVSFMLMW